MITAFDELVEAWVELLEGFGRALGLDRLFSGMVEPWLTEPVNPPATPVVTHEITQHGGTEL